MCQNLWIYVQAQICVKVAVLFDMKHSLYNYWSLSWNERPLHVYNDLPISVWVHDHL